MNTLFTIGREKIARGFWNATERKVGISRSVLNLACLHMCVFVHVCVFCIYVCAAYFLYVFIGIFYTQQIISFIYQYLIFSNECKCCYNGYEIYSLASSVHSKSSYYPQSFIIILIVVTHLTFLGCLVCVRLYAKLFITY